MIGRVRLRFEPSTLPEHVGKRIVVIRVVEILEPIRFWSAEKNEEKPLLQVGELVPSEGVYDSPPLCFNLDGPKPYRSGVNKIVRLLQLLWQGDPLLKKTTTSTGTEPVQSPAVFHTVSNFPSESHFSHLTVLCIVTGMGQLDHPASENFGPTETSRKEPNASRSRSASFRPFLLLDRPQNIAEQQ